MTHRDLKATNTAKAPNRVVPAKGKGLGIRDGAVKGKLPPRSWSMVRVSV
jgi:alpha-L-arabinofuranosidase